MESLKGVADKIMGSASKFQSPTRNGGGMLPPIRSTSVTLLEKNNSVGNMMQSGGSAFKERGGSLLQAANQSLEITKRLPSKREVQNIGKSAYSMTVQDMANNRRP